MKQTAVEWLIKCLKGQKNDPFNYEEWSIAFEYAKEMEKEQIIEAASDHCYPTCELAKIDAEEYYNKTFKSE
jgi:hypothetical protein